MLCCEWMFMG